MDNSSFSFTTMSLKNQNKSEIVKIFANENVNKNENYIKFNIETL